MSKFLVSVVEAVRVDSVAEVEQFHKQLKEDKRFDLKKFEYAHKDVKAKGEIIDSYELVKATLVFNNEKEPDCTVNIDFNVQQGAFPSVDTEGVEF